MAGPDVLGISQGASLAVALSLLAGIHVGGLVLMAVIGALIYLLFLLWMSKYLRSPHYPFINRRDGGIYDIRVHQYNGGF